MITLHKSLSCVCLSLCSLVRTTTKLLLLPFKTWAFLKFQLTFVPGFINYLTEFFGVSCTFCIICTPTLSLFLTPSYYAFRCNPQNFSLVIPKRFSTWIATILNFLLWNAHSTEKSTHTYFCRCKEILKWTHKQSDFRKSNNTSTSLYTSPVERMYACFSY